MVKRLTELYQPGDKVEILLGDVWQAGEVLRHQPPGVWVKAEDGRHWFVTNTRRIRHRAA